MKDTKSLWDAAVPRYPEFAGKVAIVTGSSRDIGRGIVTRLAREGMRVVINSRTESAVTATARELADLGAEALPVVADISEPDDVDRLFDETLEAFGTVDLLVNNAADLRRERMFDMPEEWLDAGLATNVAGPYRCALRAAEVMRPKSAGSIIHISTIGALRAHARAMPYDFTKGAIDMMTRAMAVDLGEYGIRVNAVAPGATPGHRVPAGADPKTSELLQRYPLRGLGTYLDIASAVAFLASPEAAYITGHILYVDGGVTAQLAPPHAQV